MINSQTISIAEINAITSANLEIMIKIKVSITNAQALNSLTVNLRKITDIYSVERDFKWEQSFNE